MLRLCTAVISVALLVAVPGAGHALAQPFTLNPSPEIELRLGALWPVADAQDRLAMGGRISLRPWAAGPLKRLSAQFTGDYRDLGGENAYDEAFQLRSRVARRLFVLGAGVGFDVHRTPTVAVDVRAGVSMLRTRTNFLIDSSQGFVADDDEWENVCPFQGFSERCGTEYDATPTLSFAMRRDMVRSGMVVVGLDYSWLFRGHHVLVGTLGLRLR